MKRLALLFAMAMPALAQSVATNAAHVVVAHDRVIDVWKAGALTTPVARADGVETAGAIAISDTHAAVVDQIHNRVAIVDFATGKSIVAKTHESPVAVAFAGRELLVVDHDASAVERISPDGSSTMLNLALDPAMLAVEGDHAYVYSRVSGVLQEIGLAPFAVTRTLAVPAFASSMIVAGTIAYLTYPFEGRVRAIDVATMAMRDETRVGSTPIDIARAAEPTALTARLLVVADPVSKHLWVIEAQQKPSEVFGRSFLRGFIGLGLFSGKNPGFPRWVDRVVAHDAKYLAFDSWTGTLYSAKKDAVAKLATGLGPRAFALTPGHVAVWWQNGTLVAQKLD
jgi:hypothetical protein